MVIIAYQQRRPSMNTQTNPLNFELELLPQPKIERLYGFTPLNQQLFEALYINQSNQELLEQHLPDFFSRLDCLGYEACIGDIIQTTVPIRFKDHFSAGIPFRMIESESNEINLINPNNFSDELFTIQEASLAYSIFAHNHLYDNSDNDFEQDFCIFMMEYAKGLISHNYRSKDNNPQNNMSGISKLID